MDQEQIEFRVLFRNPKYPLIIISEDKLSSASNIKQLAVKCVASKLTKDEKVIIAIDSTGEEFWYSPEKFVISPGFSFKKWTKNKIIALYNDSSNAKASNEKYPLKSLSNKKLSRIIGEICKLLSNNELRVRVPRSRQTT